MNDYRSSNADVATSADLIVSEAVTVKEMELDDSRIKD